MPKIKEHRGQGIDPSDFDRLLFTQFQTWLGETQGVEGCPVNCRYCFFKLDGLTPIQPQELTSPETVLEQLKFAPTYYETIPIHFGSQTDAFSTRSNIEYYSKMLELYGQSEYPNPLVFITKRKIPEQFIRLSKTIPQDVIFFVSYSGLAGTELEPTVVENHQRENFVKLYENDAPTVHYWRPFMPQNSNPEKLIEILDHVSKYASCSVINGLRLNSGILEQVSPFWPELKSITDFKNLGEVWPTGVQNSIKKLISNHYPNYPIFFGNTPCAVSRSLHQPDRAGLLGGQMCLQSSCDQREYCQEHSGQPSWEEVASACKEMGIDPNLVQLDNQAIYIQNEISTQSLVYLKNRLRFPVISDGINYIGGHNWANVNDKVPITEIEWS